MALTMNDLKTVDDFSSGEYSIEIKMNENAQYSVVARLKDQEHVIHTAGGRHRATRNLPYLVEEVCSICKTAMSIKILLGDKSFTLDTSDNQN